MNPDDDEVRRVYADRLLERGDPRGEFIALQLGPRSDASARREAALLKAHGHTWLGSLDCHLTRGGRRWERGFLAAGTLVDGDGLDDPLRGRRCASSSSRGTSRCIARRRRSRSSSCRGCAGWSRCAACRKRRRLSVLTSERPRLRELAFTFATRRGEETLLDGAGVPNLDHLSIDARFDALPWLLATPFAARLRRLTGRGASVDDLGAWISSVAAQVAAHRLPLAEIAFDQLSSRADATTWRFLATGAGFATLHASPIGASTLPDRVLLVRALASLRADALAELTIAPTRTSTYNAGDFDAVEAALARFRGVRAQVPWERVPPAAHTAMPALALRLSRDTPLAGLWRHLARLPHAIPFDSYELDTRGHRPLPPDPWPHIAELVDRPRTTRVRVYARGRGEELAITGRCDVRLGARLPRRRGRDCGPPRVGGRAARRKPSHRPARW